MEKVHLNINNDINRKLTDFLFNYLNSLKNITVEQTSTKSFNVFLNLKECSVCGEFFFPTNKSQICCKYGLPNTGDADKAYRNNCRVYYSYMKFNYGDFGILFAKYDGEKLSKLRKKELSKSQYRKWYSKAILLLNAELDITEFEEILKNIK